MKIATGESLHTGAWAPDNFHLSFDELGKSRKSYIVGADGSSLRQLPTMGIKSSFNPVWSPDQKSLYASTFSMSAYEIWKWNVGDSQPEKLSDNCCWALDADPGGQYLIGFVPSGERTGIYEFSIPAAGLALKVPFVFPMMYDGNAYDFSRDLSTVVYARPGGHADLYLLSQK